MSGAGVADLDTQCSERWFREFESFQARADLGRHASVDCHDDGQICVSGAPQRQSVGARRKVVSANRPVISCRSDVFAVDEDTRARRRRIHAKAPHVLLSGQGCAYQQREENEY